MFVQPVFRMRCLRDADRTVHMHVRFMSAMGILISRRWKISTWNIFVFCWSSFSKYCKFRVHFKLTVVIENGAKQKFWKRSHWRISSKVGEFFHRVNPVWTDVLLNFAGFTLTSRYRIKPRKYSISVVFVLQDKSSKNRNPYKPVWSAWFYLKRIFWKYRWLFGIFFVMGSS